MSVWLVCGGRNFTDRDYVWETLDSCVVQYGAPDLLISGGATGADDLAIQWAYTRRLPRKVFPADWKAHGRAAGSKRNQQMLDEGRPDLVIAFPGGVGTDDMCARALKAGLKVLLLSS